MWLMMLVVAATVPVFGQAQHVVRTDAEMENVYGRFQHPVHIKFPFPESVLTLNLRH